MRSAATIFATFSLVVAGAIWLRGAFQIFRTVARGTVRPPRTDSPWLRTRTLLREVIAHSKLRRRSSGIWHWFVAVAFIALAPLLVEAIALINDPESNILGLKTFHRVGIGLIALAGFISITVLTAIRLVAGTQRTSRFFGSNRPAGFFVEAVIAIVTFAIAAQTAIELNLVALDTNTAHAVISTLAFIKVLISAIWLAVVGLTPTMGVAWHRFTAFFNIWMQKNADGSPALGPLDPVIHNNAAVDWQDPADDLVVGYGTTADLSQKTLLDLSTCTECGRCQDVCPAWATNKPLSPKLFVTSLRDAAFAHNDPLGLRGGDNAPVDDDALWSCTTCGACVVECPVDIEHVDLIVDVRRNAVVMDSEFPQEYQGLYRNLERSGNPWGAPAASRISWVSELDFSVRVLGDDGTDVIPPDIEWLFWVGCAGAYDPKARETTKAVAELLTRADCKFMILGDREKCTGDPARRTGNELLFQELAQENVETLNAAGVKYIVVTCPHCLNSLGREYPQLNGHYEVVHHTDLLSYLYPADTVDAGADSVTFHDPCYLARHNGITEPGRQLIAAAGLSLTEMPRNKERTFCCGAGGGQMWKEENLGTRVRDNRLDEARSINAEIIATACPFCTVMLDDSGAEKPVEVREVSTLLLHHIRSFEKSSES